MTPSRSCLTVLFSVLVLGGCAVVPAHDYGYEPAPAVIVHAPPPAPLVEYRGLPPGGGYIWLDGYWNWGGVRYAWVPGRWVSPPPGHIWVPRVWQRDGDRWHSRGGHWEERRPPPQPAWQRREFLPQPVPRQPESPRRPEWHPEPQPEPHQHLQRDGGPPAARQEQSPRPAEAVPPRKGPDEVRRRGRKWPDDGEPANPAAGR